MDGNLDSLIRGAEAALEEEVEEGRRKRLEEWKLKMRVMGGDSYKWIRGREEAISYHVYEAEGVTEEESKAAGSIMEALNKLRRHWRKVWGRIPCDEVAAFERWKLAVDHACDREEGHLGAITGRDKEGGEVVWRPFTPEELCEGGRRAHGKAAGSSGWSGNEVAGWPKQAWEAMTYLVNDMMELGVFPEAWREVRQTHLVKPGAKQREKDCATPVGSLRPLSIQCVIQRTVASAFMHRPEVRTWSRRWSASTQWGAVAGKGLEGAIADLGQVMDNTRGGTLLSLDLARAFDNAQPGLALACLAAVGFPLPMRRLCSWSWRGARLEEGGEPPREEEREERQEKEGEGERDSGGAGKDGRLGQRRWLQLAGCTAPQYELVRQSLPQGDPVSPLALNILMLGPTVDMESILEEGEESQAVFLDDRNIACRTWQRAVAVGEGWAGWMRTLGLKENVTKTKVTAMGRGSREVKRRFEEKKKEEVEKERGQEEEEEEEVRLKPQFADAVRVLGVDFGGFRGQAPTNCIRWKKAEARLERLRFFPGTLAQRGLLARSLCVSAASWGWWRSRPSRTMVSRWCRQLNRALRIDDRWGNPDMTKLLAGHWYDMAFYSGQEAARAWYRARKQRSEEEEGEEESQRQPSDQRMDEGDVALVEGAPGSWEEERGRRPSGRWEKRAAEWGRRYGVLPGDLGPTRWPKAAHRAREVWREEVWEAARKRDRADGRDMTGAEQVYRPEVRRRALAAWQEVGWRARKILAGGAVSLRKVRGIFAAGGTEEEVQCCPWCGGAPPDWVHVAWHCQAQPLLAARPARPPSLWSCRTAWQLEAPTSVIAATAEYLGEVQNLVWRQTEKEQVAARVAAFA